jgi:hypothetical protein
MIFKDKYTTQRLISADAVAKPEEKTGEDKKIAVSEEAFLNAEMIQALINKLEQARISGLMRK